MSSKQIMLGVCFVMISITSASAKSWRGIEPLHSMRADVVRLLGIPIDGKSPYMWIYDFPEERAFIHFASGEPCEEGLPDGSKAPKDMVLVIDLYPRVPKKMAEVLTAGKEYETVQAAHTPHVYYFDSDEGTRFTVQDGVVSSIGYGGTAKDKDYRCGEYKYAAPFAPGVKLKGREHYPFDEFGNISYQDAKARLDNFVIQLFNLLEQEPEWRGYIVVYAGRRSYTGEAQHKGNCYKDYLVRVRKMDPAKIFTADGGFREDMEVELYLSRADYIPPILLPTVSPKKVQVVKRRLRSCNE